MTKVLRRTFCCCIPVRVGVILLGILGLIGGSGVAAIAIINLKRQEGSKTASILQIIIYILLAFISIFGLIGAVSRRLGFIRLYVGMLITHLLFSMGSGIYAIHRNFKDAPKYISDCASGSEDAGVLRVCQNGAALLKSVMIGVFILAWLLETWACFIVVSYNKQLVEEEQTKSIVKDTESW
jgi:cytochrome b